MKTSKDPRHLERIKVVQELFSWNFSRENKPQHETTQEVIKRISKIDKFIKQSAPAWPVEKINKLDLAILRLAVYELKIKKNAPIKVIIDEAVEIAKQYGADSSASFINGALGKLVSDEKISPS